MVNGRRKQSKDDEDVPLTLELFRDEISRMKEELRAGIVKDVLKVLKEEITVMKEQIESHDNDIEQIKSYIVNLETHRLKEERKALGNNVVIRGLTETKDETAQVTEAKVHELLNSINANINSFSKVERIGSNNNNNCRLIKVTANCRDDRNTILSKAKLLHKSNEYKRVFLNADRPLLDRKEAARLRALRKEITAQNPHANVKIERGKLFLDNAEIDKERPLRHLFPLD